MVHRGLYSYRQRVLFITLLPNIVFVLFLYVERFCKSFWKESLTRASSSLYNAACALSCPGRCFQLSTNLGKDFFRYLWYCDKKQIECGLAWHWWNSTGLGLINWHVFKQSECRNCCLYIIIQKIRKLISCFPFQLARGIF